MAGMDDTRAMTYTVKLPDARHVSTMLDALQAQRILLDRSLESHPVLAESFREEIQRIDAMRSILLAANQDATVPASAAVKRHANGTVCMYPDLPEMCSET